MRLRVSTAMVAFVLFSVFSWSGSLATELARVGDYIITTDEFIEEFRVGSVRHDAPEKTLEGRKEFLDRLIAKHLLSYYFHSRGWDTFSTPLTDSILALYEEPLYLQALYIDGIPETSRPWEVGGKKLVDLAKLFVDSLLSTYDVKVDEKAIIFIVDKSRARMKAAPADTEGNVLLEWGEVFTDEEKKLVAATCLVGTVTIGEFVAHVEKMPPFVRPAPGNSDQIVLTVEQIVQNKIFKYEFDKRNLWKQKWFQDRMTNKREGLVAGWMFHQIADTVSVAEEEAKSYYEKHIDYFRTFPLINVAMISLQSEEVAREIKRRIDEGEDFESVAVDFSVYTRSKTGYDTTGFIGSSEYPELFDAIWDKGVGEVAGPVFEHDLWIVAKLLGRKDTRLLSFGEAEPIVVSNMRFLKADQALADLIGDLRAKVPVKINEEVLQALELPEYPQPK
jgi:peptidyl-prolyl cis-trans isomerase C